MKTETFTPSVQTTFLPKNNQLDFYVRGGVRSSKGRIFGSKPNEPIPPPPPTTIGEVSVTVNGIDYTNETLTLLVNDPTYVVVSITGDAETTYTWKARTNYPLLVSSQTASTVLTFPQEGLATVTCDLIASSASDNPKTVILNLIIVTALD